MAQEFKNKTNANNNNNETPQVFTTGGGPAATSSGKTAAFSSGLGNSQPSGRFTNLQNYLSANKDASASMAERANKNINKSFGQQQQDVTEKNKQINAAFTQGRSNVETGQGFQTNLEDINKNLNEGYTNFGDRAGFNQAAQQAGNLATNQQYTNIASGQGFDEAKTKALQDQALLNAQGLNRGVSQNLQNIQTEQGRNTLFNAVLRPKAGYSDNQQALDKLFLQQGLGNIQKNLQGKQQEAASLLSGTTGQQASLQDITGREKELVDKLSTLSGQAQNTFNEKLYGQDNLQGNIDLVNQARQERYNDLVNQLKAGGSISKDDVAMLGLDVANNFQNVTPGTMGSFAESTPKSYNTSGISLLNSLKDPTKINEFLQQGKQAISAQDITTQEDYDLYKGLEALTGKQSGLVGGTSQLGSSVVGVGGRDTRDLGGYVASQNQALEDKLRSGQLDTTVQRQYSPNYATLSSNQGLELLKNLTPEQKEFLTKQGGPTAQDYQSGKWDLLKNIIPQITTGYNPTFSGSGNMRFRQVDSQGGRDLAAYNALSDALSKYNQEGINNTLNIVDNPTTTKKFGKLL